MIQDWWHGDAELRMTLQDQRWDRNPQQSSRLEHGPGIYFTESKEQARTYGPYLYRFQLDGWHNRLLYPKVKPSYRFLCNLTEDVAAEDMDRLRIDLDCRNNIEVLQKYNTHQGSRHDAAVSLYGDLFRYDAEAWIEAMVRSGYDGTVVRRPQHDYLVLWNPKKYKIQTGFEE